MWPAEPRRAIFLGASNAKFNYKLDRSSICCLLCCIWYVNSSHAFCSLTHEKKARPPVVHPTGQDPQNPFRYTGQVKTVSDFGRATKFTFDIEHDPRVVVCSVVKDVLM